MRAAADRSLTAAVSLVASDDPSAVALDESAASPMFELLALIEELASPPLKSVVPRLRSDLKSTIGLSPVKALGRLRREERLHRSEARLDPAGRKCRRAPNLPSLDHRNSPA